MGVFGFVLFFDLQGFISRDLLRKTNMNRIKIIGTVLLMPVTIQSAAILFINI